jgi:uncharacterized iron-regulated membrane protein
MLTLKATNKAEGTTLTKDDWKSLGIIALMWLIVLVLTTLAVFGVIYLIHKI